MPKSKPKPKPKAKKPTKRIQTRLRNKKPAFLAAFRATCNITESARRARIDKTMHYRWMREDPQYAADFEASLEEARGNLTDTAVRLGNIGAFEPHFYKGAACYAKRKRVMCKLADGTTGFLDELPKGAKIVERKTVFTADGEQLGTWRIDTGLLGKLLAAWVPEFGNKVEVSGELEVTSPDDAKRELLRKLAGVLTAPSADGGDRKPD